MTLSFPDVSPIALAIGPLKIRWYSLAYLAGILFSWVMVRNYAKKDNSNLTPKLVDDFVSWAIIAIIAGGRLGYVLFYNLSFYLTHPTKIIAVWDGGMSFHGAVLLFICTVLGFCFKHKINPFRLGDYICLTAPIGLFLGRLANFVNGELYGRKAPDFAYAVIFPSTDGVPRHASQIYEAVLEGLAIFIILNLLWRIKSLQDKKGFFAGMFFILYGVFRAFIELLRQPDIQLGFVIGPFTMGQILCLPMVIFGIWLIWYSFRRSKDA